MDTGIRVLLVDDHELARRGLRRMLELDADIQVVGEASNADEALGLVDDLSPDVVMMDIQMGYINGLEATRLLKDRGFAGAVLILSMYEEYLDQAIQARAEGYLVKDAKREELISSIRDAASGHFIFGASLLRSPQKMNSAFEQLHRQWAEAAAPQDGHVPQEPRNAPLNGALEENAGVEQSPGQLAKEPPEPSQNGTDPVSSPSLAPLDTVVTNVELVIPPPLEPGAILKLHQWLREVARADVGEIAGSWMGDTVMTMTLRQPIPLLRMLAELPDVAEVTEEPYREGTQLTTGVLRSTRDMLEIGVGRTLPKRFRLALKGQ